MEGGSTAGEASSSTDNLAVVEPLDEVEPADFWEKEQVANQLQAFRADNVKGDVGKAESMAMLVAVRLRPLWEKVRNELSHSPGRIVHPEFPRFHAAPWLLCFVHANTGG